MSKPYACKCDVQGSDIPEVGVIWGLYDSEPSSLNVLTTVMQPHFPYKKNLRVHCLPAAVAELEAVGDDHEIACQSFMIPGRLSLFRMPVRELISAIGGQPVVLKNTGTMEHCGGCPMPMEPTGKPHVTVQLDAKLELLR